MVKQDGSAELRPVVVGDYVGGKDILIVSGLQAGDGLRRGAFALQAGQQRFDAAGVDVAGLLDQYITIVSAATILSYSLYTFSAPNLPDNHVMMLTIPFVVYAIFRYLYLVEVKSIGGEPEEILLKDRPLQVSILLWALAVLAVFYLT